MKNFFPVGKPGAKTTYADKAACELAEGQECFDITGIDLETHDLVDVPVLDLEGQPIYEQVPVLDGQGQPTYEQVPVLDEQGAPVLDGQGNPVMQNGAQIFENGPQIFKKEFQLNQTKADAKAASQAQVAKVQDRTQARQFCLSIVDEIAAINKDLNDPQLMATIFSTANFQAIILALLTGGTATARALMAQHGPSLYPQATVDSLVAKMDAFIASEQ